MGVNNYKIGNKYTTKDGYKIRLIEYFKFDNCTIKFYDGTIRYNQNIMTIEKGLIKKYNKIKYSKNSFFIGKGKFPSSRKSYSCWKGMLNRCYNRKLHKKAPTYKDCSVSDEWHNFKYFLKWFDENYIETFHLDKDILVKGNKVYGPDTCCFVPREINQLFVTKQNGRGDLPIGVSKSKNRCKYRSNIMNRTIGVFETKEEAFNAYKEAKENHIKEVADKWKGKISKKVYDAMYDYKVEITD